MRPRLVLALVAVTATLALAGCAHPAGSISMNPVDDAGLADEASRDVPDAESSRQRADRRLVVGAIENGSATANDTSPPVEGGLPFAYEGRYYNVTHTVTGEGTGYQVGIEIDYNATDFEGAAVDYGELPQPDRDAVGPLLAGPREGRQPGYDIGIGATYTADEYEASTLASGEYDAIRYEGETYPIRVHGAREVTISTYRYEASVVAGSASEYAADLRDRYAFTLSGLSDAERSIVEEAAGGSYYPESTDDTAFENVVDRFREHDPVHRPSGSGSGAWLVRHDGQLYWAQLDYYMFVEDTDDAVASPGVTPH